MSWSLASQLVKALPGRNPQFYELAESAQGSRAGADSAKTTCGLPLRTAGRLRSRCSSGVGLTVTSGGSQTTRSTRTFATVSRYDCGSRACRVRRKRSTALAATGVGLHDWRHYPKTTVRSDSASPTPSASGDPFTVHDVITRLRRAAPQIKIGIHAHNDLGLATANSLAAVRAGASAIDVTVGGLGERAGNAALEQVAMALEGDWVR